MSFQAAALMFATRAAVGASCGGLTGALTRVLVGGRIEHGLTSGVSVVGDAWRIPCATLVGCLTGFAGEAVLPDMSKMMVMATAVTGAVSSYVIERVRRGGQQLSL